MTRVQPAPSRRSAEHGFTPSWRCAEHGFTLVEMMVSLFIFGLLAASGVSLLAFSVRSQAAASERLDAVGDAQRMTALIAGDLAQVVPRLGRDSDGRPVRAFAGTDGAVQGAVMRYVRSGRSNPDGAARAGIERVELVVADGRLERRSYPMVDGSMPGAPTLLADAVESVALRYRSRDGWQPQWDAPDGGALPRAVEMTVKRRGEPAMLYDYLVGTSYR